MDLTNDACVIQIRPKIATERYWRDKIGWMTVSTRGRMFRVTAERVLNHVQPVLAGIKPSVAVEVEHRVVLPRSARDIVPAWFDA